MNFYDTPICRSRKACETCRTSKVWRESLLKHGFVEERDFPCPPPPLGLSLPIASSDEEMAGLGTLLEKALGMIPGFKRLPCYDSEGKLKPDSSCGKRKASLNKLFPG